ncbi:MAG TPA: zf-HC2 domain-containing protein [Longimicrobiales bacterium]
MSHAAEGTLQAYLDGAIEGAAAAALSDHVAGCVACAGELESLRRAHERVGGALAVLDAGVEVPMLRAQARLARERRSRRLGVARLGTWSLAKAAMLLLVLAGAGAAAIPDVRRAIGATLERVAQLFGSPEQPVAVPTTEAPVQPVPAGEPETGMTFVTPSEGRVRVILHAPAGRVDVVVRLIDGARARVETVMEDAEVRRRAGNGRLELMGLGTGTVLIGIPRAVPSAAVEVDGEVLVYKQGEMLRGSGPASAERGSEVRFTTGS